MNFLHSHFIIKVAIKEAGVSRQTYNSPYNKWPHTTIDSSSVMIKSWNLYSLERSIFKQLFNNRIILIQRIIKGNVLFFVG